MNWPWRRNNGHRHEWQERNLEPHLTGQITLRIEDGAVLATWWSDWGAVCRTCGAMQPYDDGRFKNGKIETGHRLSTVTLAENFEALKRSMTP